MKHMTDIDVNVGFNPETNEPDVEYWVSFSVIIEKIGRIDRDDKLGGSYMNYWKVHIDTDPLLIPEIDKSIASRVIWELFPAEYCQHEYDCCGRFYPDGGYIVGKDYDDCWIVAEGYTQNV